MSGIREKGFELYRVGIEAQALEVGFNVTDSLECGFRTGNVRMEGKGTEVGRESVVGGGGKEVFVKAEGGLRVFEGGW